MYACPVFSVCTRGMSYRGRGRGVLTCYPDTDLVTAKDLMEAKDIQQLPVVMRGGDSREERRRRVVAVLHYDSISNYLRLAGSICFISLASSIISIWLFILLYFIIDAVLDFCRIRIL